VGEGTFRMSVQAWTSLTARFERNTAAVEGGAIVFDSLTTTVRHTRFESNVATVTAGAVATTKKRHDCKRIVFRTTHVLHQVCATISMRVQQQRRSR